MLRIFIKNFNILYSRKKIRVLDTIHILIIGEIKNNY